MSKKTIAWEKWDESIIEEEMMEEVFEEEDADLVENALQLMNRIPKLVTTPAGVFQLHDKMNVLAQFDCWMGYTNFDLTKQSEKILDAVEGIEMLTIISRYRFFIGIGKLFNFKNVRKTIELELCGEAEKSEDNDEMWTSSIETVQSIRSLISDDKYWAIFVSVDGEVQYASTNNDDDERYLSQLLMYEKTKKTLGGLIFQNE